jgi:hypothetical protein
MGVIITAQELSFQTSNGLKVPLPDEVQRKYNAILPLQRWHSNFFLVHDPLLFLLYFFSDKLRIS